MASTSQFLDFMVDRVHPVNSQEFDTFEVFSNGPIAQRLINEPRYKVLRLTQEFTDSSNQKIHKTRYLGVFQQIKPVDIVEGRLIVDYINFFVTHTMTNVVKIEEGIMPAGRDIPDRLIWRISDDWVKHVQLCEEARATETNQPNTSDSTNNKQAAAEKMYIDLILADRAEKANAANIIEISDDESEEDSENDSNEKEETSDGVLSSNTPSLMEEEELEKDPDAALEQEESERAGRERLARLKRRFREMGCGSDDDEEEEERENNAVVKPERGMKRRRNNRSTEISFQCGKHEVDSEAAHEAAHKRLRTEGGSEALSEESTRRKSTVETVLESIEQPSPQITATELGHEDEARQAESEEEDQSEEGDEANASDASSEISDADYDSDPFEQMKSRTIAKMRMREYENSLAKVNYENGGKECLAQRKAINHDALPTPNSLPRKMNGSFGNITVPTQQLQPREILQSSNSTSATTGQVSKLS